MTTPILTAKLFIPPPRPGVVTRRRLLERLDEGLYRKLILISAPAGFGKTTLVSEWLAGCGQPVAWLSLDEGDNQPDRFLDYLVASLQTISPGLSPTATNEEGILGTFQAAQAQPVESILTPLINQLATVPGHFILVLDDYHLIESEPVDQILDYLLEHLPLKMHLLVITREDPNLPLARLRARSQLIELRATDLRFTLAESAEFLNREMKLALTTGDITALETRTEGWIAGLQLAALSMQGRPDTAGFIRAFTGSHRFVLDYLTEEVLRRQPKHGVDFLLQTAILDRMCGSLCDAVTSCSDGKVTLEALERENLFIIPLDDERRWYRYHHLFAEMLRSRLFEAQPDRLPLLHRKASFWYEQNSLPAEAIRHAFAAKDFERAANLVEGTWAAMDVALQSGTWLNWARALPDNLIRVRPVLSVGYAWALLDSGDMETCEPWLQVAEEWLATPSPEMVVADEEQFRVLPATIAAARAYRAMALGNIPEAIKHARAALDLSPDPDDLRRIQTMALFGLAQYANGDLEAADRSLTEFRDFVQNLGDVNIIVGISFVLAEIKRARGRLREAENTCRQALQFAAGQGTSMPTGACDLYRCMAEFACERGDLETAAQHLLKAQNLGEQAPSTGWPHRLCISQARLKQVQGDLAGALTLLDEAKYRFVRSPLPDVRPIAALQARIWVAQGRLAEALKWAGDQGLSTADEPVYTREFEHITLASLLIARYQNTGDRQEIILFLERLLRAAGEGDRIESVIEIRLLQALAYQAQNDLPQALESLEQAFALAQPEDFVQLFLDRGQEMLVLLREAAGRGIAPDFVTRLLAASGEPEIQTPFPQALLEPLSERELDVLRLLETELNGPEIARELSVSISTLRTHTKNIYAKLGVNNRLAALHRAEELHLL